MTVPFNKFIVKKCSRMRFQLLFFLILATMLFKLASILSIEYLGEEDCKILPKELYTLIQSRTDAAFHHGYRRVSRCGQYFYLDEMKNFKNGELISPSAEKYAETLKSKKGTGYIDFQYPDAVSETVDHGYVFFPFVSNCRGGETREPYEIFLSTMITADGFRPALFDFFLEYYSEVGVSFENMLFTIQVSEQTNVSSLKTLLAKLRTKNIYYDIQYGSWTSESLMFHQAHKLLFCTRSEDWIIVADSDEFHEYPGANVNTFVRQLMEQGYNFANGLFLDRIAISGALEELKSEGDIFTQFPLGCRLHKRLSLGTPKKVMIFRGDLRINRGHHRIALCWFWQRRNQLHLSPWATCPSKDEDVISPYPKRLNVHHFKWMKGQLEATERKARTWGNTSTGRSYRNVLAYLQRCMGLCVNDDKIRCKHMSSNSLN
mmetsp:Transcript_3433/g.12197  ORF Transcript_3433/g.12197 Transcript_3433/m.12197 type:complete len:432 (-) Transcript_3433:892-2187(-)